MKGAVDDPGSCIRVVIATRSPLQRARASALLANRQGVRVVDTIRGDEGVLERIAAAGPDVLLLGAGMLENPEEKLLEQIRQRHPCPVVLLTTTEADPRVLEGLEHGAVEFLLLPVLSGGDREEADQAVELIRHVASSGTTPAGGRPEAVPAKTIRPSRSPRPALVLIGASTGGPQAVQTVLEALPGDLNAALLVALHMPSTFTGLYAERLDRSCVLKVREAVDGSQLRVGTAFILPGGQQGDLVRLGSALRVRLRSRQPGEFHAPSVNRVMASAAGLPGVALVGIVLTGMGGDGAQGLLAVRDAGGETIAESEGTAVIFGMPGEAIRSGAARTVLPLPEIPRAILSHCGTRPGNPAPEDD